MSVKTQHPEYAKHLPLWLMMRDALDGEIAIKNKGEVYLPKTAGMITVEQDGLDPDSKIYGGYKDRAQYPHWVRDSLRSMTGLVARLQPEQELQHTFLEPLKTSATDDGFGLDQLFLRCCNEALSYGRFGLLVDFDDSSKPYIAMYNTTSIINWKTGDIGGRRDLTLLVLEEHHQKDMQDRFSHDTEIRYRVLELEDGYYKASVLDQSGNLIEEVTPNFAGTRLDFIPFVFGGSLNNSIDIDDIPLLTMAKSAKKYYQLSADYFQSLYLTAHPQPYITGATDVELKVTGPMAVWELPAGATANYLEIQGNGIEKTKAEMDAQKNAAVEAGAKVIDAGSNESGEARKARQDDQHATLHTVVKACAEAVEQACKYVALWQKLDDSEIRFSVAMEFAQDIDAQVLAQLSNLMLAGKISTETVWDYLQTGKIPERDFEEESLKIEQGNANVPLGSTV